MMTLCIPLYFPSIREEKKKKKRTDKMPPLLVVNSPPEPVVGEHYLSWLSVIKFYSVYPYLSVSLGTALLVCLSRGVHPLTLRRGS